MRGKYEEAVEENQNLKSAKAPEKLEDREYATWKARDILLYFRRRYFKVYGRILPLTKREIPAVTARIARFQDIHRWSPVEYKEFSDAGFERFYNSRFVPVLGHLTSEKMFQLTTQMPRNGQGTNRKVAVDWGIVRRRDEAAHPIH